MEQMIFDFDEKELEAANDFIAECLAKDFQLQKDDPDFDSPFKDFEEMDGVPYHGAIGGAITYCFTPTSIGTIIVIKYKSPHLTAEKNITNYSNW